jgi:D-xylonolactonase
LIYDRPFRRSSEISYQRFWHRAWKIHILDYDQASGCLTNRRIFTTIRQEENEGKADGLAVDSEGGVWSARFGGGVLVRYLPDGSEERRIPIPARKVSSLTFGGHDLKDIYITTAGDDDRASDRSAGAVFKLTLGVKGLPRHFSRICL